MSLFLKKDDFLEIDNKFLLKYKELKNLDKIQTVFTLYGSYDKYDKINEEFYIIKDYYYLKGKHVTVNHKLCYKFEEDRDYVLYSIQLRREAYTATIIEHIYDK